MKFKDSDTGAFIERAELHLEGSEDLEKLQRAIDTYKRHVRDQEGTFVIALPLPSDRPGMT
jgi:hypothetical protein